MRRATIYLIESVKPSENPMLVYAFHVSTHGILLLRFAARSERSFKTINSLRAISSSPATVKPDGFESYRRDPLRSDIVSFVGNLY